MKSSCICSNSFILFVTFIVFTFVCRDVFLYSFLHQHGFVLDFLTPCEALLCLRAQIPAVDPNNKLFSTLFLNSDCKLYYSLTLEYYIQGVKTITWVFPHFYLKFIKFCKHFLKGIYVFMSNLAEKNSVLIKNICLFCSSCPKIMLNIILGI